MALWHDSGLRLCSWKIAIITDSGDLNIKPSKYEGSITRVLLLSGRMSYEVKFIVRVNEDDDTQNRQDGFLFVRETFLSKLQNQDQSRQWTHSRVFVKIMLLRARVIDPS